MTSHAPSGTTDTNDLMHAMKVSERKVLRHRHYSTLLVRVLQIALLLATLLIWQFVVSRGLAPKLFFSTPLEIGRFVIANWQHLVSNSLITLQAIAVGFLIGSAAGIAAALVMSRFEILERVLQPYISVLMSLPRIALAPLFIIWFGITFEAQVALAVSIVFFVVLVSTFAGTKSVDPDLKKMASTFHASNAQLFAKIIIPGSLAGVFAGLRLGVITAILGVIASEMVAASGGLGQDIIFYGQNLQAAGVFSVLLFLAVISVVLNGFVAFWERRLSRWQS